MLAVGPAKRNTHFQIGYEKRIALSEQTKWHLQKLKTTALHRFGFGCGKKKRALFKLVLESVMRS